MGEPGTSEPSSSTTVDSGGGGGSGGGPGGAHGKYDLDSLDPAVVANMTADEIKTFLNTGRTGRRNALPDVSQPDVITTSTAGIAEALESLSVQSGMYTHIYMKSK